MAKLAHDVLQAADGATVWFLHGILGSRRNWRSFVRRLGGARPDLTLVTVDLRNHGESEHVGPPNDLEACAGDLDDLAAELGDRPAVVVGHSFGGKVAMAYARREPRGLEQVWVLDANPGPVSSAADLEVSDVIAALHDIPMPVASYDALREELMARGFSRALSSWMTTNLERADGGFTWRFALGAIQPMIESYAETDFWPYLEEGSGQVHLVRAGASDRWDEPTVDRLEALARSPRRHVHLLEDAGHWVQVDAPDALRELLARHLP